MMNPSSQNRNSSGESKAEGCQSHPVAEPRKPAKIVRVRVFHKATFRALLSNAAAGVSCLRYRGRYWKPVHRGRQFDVYARAPDYLASVQERVRDYEFFFYQSLLRGRCGRDGVLRPRTCLWRSDGTYRASIGADGELS